jgi:hypothetical protein
MTGASFINSGLVPNTTNIFFFIAYVPHNLVCCLSMRHQLDTT